MTSVVVASRPDPMQRTMDRIFEPIVQHRDARDQIQPVTVGGAITNFRRLHQETPVA